MNNRMFTLTENYHKYRDWTKDLAHKKQKSPAILQFQMCLQFCSSHPHLICQPNTKFIFLQIYPAAVFSSSLNLIITNTQICLLSSPTPCPNFLCLQDWLMFYQVSSSIYFTFCFYISTFAIYWSSSVLDPLLIACYRGVSTYFLKNLKLLNTYDA